MWRQHWTEESWRKFLEEGETDSELVALRRCTHTGRPLGGAEFIQALERTTHRRLTPRQGGRPRKPLAGEG
jgi:putative transposase